MAIVGLAVILIWLALVLGGPFLLIWALNTLFGLAIPFSIETYLAGLVLILLSKTSSSVSNAKS